MAVTLKSRLPLGPQCCSVIENPPCMHNASLFLLIHIQQLCIYVSHCCLAVYFCGMILYCCKMLWIYFSSCEVSKSNLGIHQALLQVVVQSVNTRNVSKWLITSTSMSINIIIINYLSNTADAWWMYEAWFGIYAWIPTNHISLKI